MQLYDISTNHSEEEIKEIYAMKCESIPNITEEQFIAVFKTMQNHYSHVVNNTVHAKKLMGLVVNDLKSECQKLKNDYQEKVIEYQHVKREHLKLMAKVKKGA